MPFPISGQLVLYLKPFSRYLHLNMSAHVHTHRRTRTQKWKQYIRQFHSVHLADIITLYLGCLQKKILRAAEQSDNRSRGWRHRRDVTVPIATCHQGRDVKRRHQSRRVERERESFVVVTSGRELLLLLVLSTPPALPHVMTSSNQCVYKCNTSPQRQRCKLTVLDAPPAVWL